MIDSRVGRCKIEDNFCVFLWASWLINNYFESSENILKFWPTICSRSVLTELSQLLSLVTTEWYLKFTLLDRQTSVNFFCQICRHPSKAYSCHGRYLSCNDRHLQINSTLLYCQVTPTSASCIEPGGKECQIEEKGIGVLIGAVVGSTLLAGAVVLILLICWRKQKAR